MALIEAEDAVAATRGWDFSCPDWEERLRTGRSLVPDLPIDEAVAGRAMRVFDRLRIPDIPGTPTFGEACGDWFRDVVRAIFGSVDQDRAMRMVREVFLLVAKKNSKTTYDAGLLLTALILNTRRNVEFSFAGPAQETADLAFSQAAAMIDADHQWERRHNNRDGWLQSILHVQSHTKTISHRGTRLKLGQKLPEGYKPVAGTGARLKIKTFGEDIVTGSRNAGMLLDEIHLLGKKAKAAAILGQIRGGMQANREAFLVINTTQSFDEPAGVFLTELTRARAIRDGEIKNGHILPVLYEFPDDVVETDEWKDSANWPMVNPNINKSVHLDLLESAYAEAQQGGEAEIRRWCSQHLNIQIGIALKSNAWKGANYWPRNVDVNMTGLSPDDALAELIERCEVAVVGADGGGLDDLFGLAVVGREKSDAEIDQRRWLFWTHAWCIADVLKNRQDIAPKLEEFRAAGELTIYETPGEDVREIADYIATVKQSGLLPEKNAIGVDPYGIGDLKDELARREFDVSPEAGWLVGIPQGWKLNAAIKTCERRLARKALLHCGAKIMDWQCGNAKVEPRGNAVTITKQQSGTAKIDNLASLFNAGALMSMNPEAAKSVYETRGVRRIKL